ncbi:lymphocyte antigen 75-like [Pelodytes ibericus]
MHQTSDPFTGSQVQEPGTLKLLILAPNLFSYMELYVIGSRWQSLALAGRHWFSLAVTGSRWQSLALAGSHWFSLADTGSRWQSLVLAGSHWLSLAVSGSRWQSLALAGRHWLSLAVIGSRWQSLALAGSHWLSLADTGSRWQTLSLAGSHCLSLAVIGSRWQSLALAGSHWFSLAVTGSRWQSLVLAGRHWLSLAVIGSRWQSLALAGSHWLSLAVTGSRWPSLALAGSHWFSLAVTGSRWQSLACTAFVLMQLFGERNGFWTNLQNADYEKWKSGDSSKYSNWSPVCQRQFNSSSGDQNLCGLISSSNEFQTTGKWFLDKCNSEGYGFVCEKKQVIGQTFNEADMYPVPEIMEYGHKTYRIISGNMSWYDASAKCREYGAELASVTDEYHQAFLTVMVNRPGHPHWIGLLSPDVSGSRYNDSLYNIASLLHVSGAVTGSGEQNGRHFEWADGANSTFSAWEHKEPPLDGSCTYIAIYGHWINEPCDSRLEGAACLIPAEVFTIRHEQTNKCLDGTKLLLATCSATDTAQLWKWGSERRLFNLGSQKCLGIDLSSTNERLKLAPCDSSLMLWWRCGGGHIYGASMYSLAETGGSMNATYMSPDTWTRGNTAESICQVPYHVIYTTGGNSHGARCEFPFFHGGLWHHECVREINKTDEGCATTPDYTKDQKWGLCLKKVTDCDGSWTPNPTLQTCYQFNSNSSLKWKEAYESCQRQGADLLSISSAEELTYVTSVDNLPDLMWIGLNRLDRAGGWQWSDNAPLSFINWDRERSGFSRLDDSDCGLLNADTSQWQNQPCSLSLPYVCKKKLNDTGSALPDYWLYSDTQCDADWIPHNGLCYILQPESVWEDAEQSCKKANASLISLHSLADIEMVVTKFGNESKDIWSGFRNNETPASFQWSDDEDIRFTYWDQNEPNTQFNSTPNCVSISGNTGRWHVRLCNETFRYICKKNGTVKNDSDTTLGTSCASDGDWSRHGDFCYLVNKTEVAFGERCNLTVTNKFEQEFINSLMRKENKIKGGFFWTGLRAEDKSGDYYWQTREGNKDLTFSNWNSFQPDFPGGCVAMTTEQHFGKWEVKDCKTFKAQSVCKKSIGSPKIEEPEVLPKPNGSCPEGWTVGSEFYCYKLFHYERLLRTRTWEEAEGFCQEFGAHLASFAHDDEKKNFHSFLKSTVSDNRWVWIGLNKRDVASEGSWEWSDGQPISSLVLPNEFRQEDYDLRDCVAFQIYQPQPQDFWISMTEESVPNFNMKPFHCDANLEFVCQTPRGSVLKTPEWFQPDSQRMNGDLVVFGGEQFWIISDLLLSHKEAALYCASNGSELASLDSFDTVSAIKQRLRDFEKEGVNNLYFVKWWVKSVSYRPQTELLLHHFLRIPFRDCAYVSLMPVFADHYSQVNCNHKMPFICEQKSNGSLLDINSPKTNTNGSCPKNWLDVQDKCFLQIKPKYLTFNEANEECKTFGGTLPTITSQFEQDVITQLLPKTQMDVWIGLKMTLNAGFGKWIDGRDVTYKNFHPLLQGRYRKLAFNPFHEERNKQCLFILNEPTSIYAGSWDFTSCAETQNVAICQKYKGANGDGVQAPAPPVQEDVMFHDYRYRIIGGNLTWYQALVKCKEYNMSMASVTDQYQLALLAVQVGLLNQAMWIGLSSRDDGVHYRWQDGAQVTINRWSDADQAFGDCVYFDTDGFWKTSSCDTLMPGVFCYLPPEKDVMAPVENTEFCPHRVRDTPWIPFRNSCYTFLTSHKRWLSIDTQQSRDVCRALHPDSYVLNIRNEDENEFVVNQLRPFRDLVEMVWLGMDYDVTGKRLRWHDQTFVQFSNWRSGRPNVTGNHFYSAMSIDGFWEFYTNPPNNDLLHLLQQSIVACKIELDSTEKYSKPLPSTIPYEGRIYHIVQKKMDWKEAVRVCKQNGSHLASVQGDIQQSFLESLVRHDGFPLWIGLSIQNGVPSDFEWSDGSPLQYVQHGFTNNLSTGNCVYLDTKGNWRDENCAQQMDGAICYKPAETHSLAVSYPLCPYTPGSGRWILKNNYCYAFDPKMYNFSVYTSEEAKTICQKLDPKSALLTVGDEAENDFVANYLNTDAFVTSRIWLGLSPNSTAKELRWQDGSPLGYGNWNKVQREAGGQCAVLFPLDGTWHKVTCTGSYARVVCKAPLRTGKAGLLIGLGLLLAILLIGLGFYFYKKRSHLASSSVRYQRAVDEFDKAASSGDLELL